MEGGLCPGRCYDGQERGIDCGAHGCLQCAKLPWTSKTDFYMFSKLQKGNCNNDGLEIRR